MTEALRTHLISLYWMIMAALALFFDWDSEWMIIFIVAAVVYDAAARIIDRMDRQ